VWEKLGFWICTHSTLILWFLDFKEIKFLLFMRRRDRLNILFSMKIFFLAFWVVEMMMCGKNLGFEVVLTALILWFFWILKKLNFFYSWEGEIDSTFCFEWKSFFFSFLGGGDDDVWEKLGFLSSSLCEFSFFVSSIQIWKKKNFFLKKRNGILFFFFFLRHFAYKLLAVLLLYGGCLYDDDVHSN